MAGSEEFTGQERKILEPFVSNADKDVFVLMNLPEVIKGALFSRYSRSSKSLRRLLLDEFIGSDEFASVASGPRSNLSAAVGKAQGFYDRILDGYGDDSVGELGGAHLACEGISNVAAKFIEDCRIGGSPLEKSTRYVWFNTKANGEFLFFREPGIMKSKFADDYVRVNNLLFETYSRLMEPMTAFVVDRFPLEEFEFFDSVSKASLKFPEISDEKLLKRARAAYNASVKAKACDALRSFLPAGTLTNVGVFGNGRFFQGLLNKMYTSDLAELRGLASPIHAELNSVIPSFVRRAGRDDYRASVDANMRALVRRLLRNMEPKPSDDVVLHYYDRDAEVDCVAGMLYPFSNLSLQQLRDSLKEMSFSQVKEVVDSYMGMRRQRRDKPGRALEHVYYTFDLLTDFGIYRDLQRHRMMTQERQLLTTVHGYATPDEIAKAGFQEDFDQCMAEAAALYGKIAGTMPLEAQYVVPMAFKVRWYCKLNLREAFHLIELRSTPQGHPAYRRVAQDMFRKISAVHPALAHYMRFVDMKDYPLGRMGSELRKEEKREGFR